MIIKTRDSSRKILIVAEIGNNHEGNYEVARKLVHAAAEAGADAVKFQTFRTEGFVSRSDAARFRRLKSFELSYPQFEALSQLARSLGLLFVSTPLDLESADFLTGITDALKIASGDNTFYPLIQRVARSGRPVILSTGLSDLDVVDRAVKCVREEWAPGTPPGQLGLLHCVSAYPVPADQANLRAIPTLASRFDATIGYSDHTIGIEACVLAVALGARILEKHFTLDKQYSDFRDHRLSADPADLRLLVERVRQAEAALGSGEKIPQPAEREAAPLMRRSIVAGRDLPQGHFLAASDLRWTRPAGGLAPGQEGQILGKVLRRPVAEGEFLRPSDVADSDPG